KTPPRRRPRGVPQPAPQGPFALIVNAADLGTRRHERSLVQRAEGVASADRPDYCPHIGMGAGAAHRTPVVADAQEYACLSVDTVGRAHQGPGALLGTASDA